jgi:hypothetical protein
MPSDHEYLPEDRWSWRDWRTVLIISFVFVVLFGFKARNAGDQGFLYGVILLQTLTLTFIIRTGCALSNDRMAFLKIIGIGALCFVMLLLSFCSSFVQHGWG